MKDEKLIIGLSNSLFGREKNSTKYGRDAFRFYHPGSLGRRQAQRLGGVAARAVCLVQPLAFCTPGSSYTILVSKSTKLLSSLAMLNNKATNAKLESAST